jgi:tetratricopeptide (TPR) repeat protein
MWYLFFPELAAIELLLTWLASSDSGFLSGKNSALVDAYAEASQAIQHDPLDANAHFIRGLILKGDGDYAEALGDIRAVVRIEPRHARAWLMISEVLTALREYDEAKTARQKALEIDPSLS